MKTLNMLIIFLLLLLCKSVTGQDSLVHYMTTAIERNAEVSQKFYEYKAAIEEITQNALPQDPQLNAGVLLQPMELIMGKQLAEFQIMQMFPWFGTLRAAKDEMGLMANAKYESLRDTKLQTAFNVQKMWFEMYKTYRQILIAEDNLKILQSIERLSVARYKTAPTGTVTSSAPVGISETKGSESIESMGSMGQSNNNYNPVSSSAGSMSNSSMGASSGSNFGLPDLYKIQIEMGDIENNIAYLKSQQKVNTARFNSYLNRSANYPVTIADTLVADTLIISENVLKDSMLSNNPMLTMLEYEKQSLEARKRMVNRMGYPMIGLGLSYTVIKKNEMSAEKMNGRDMIMPMVSTTLPVYRNKYRSMKNEADYLIQANQSARDIATRNLETEFEQAIQLYTDGMRREKLYTEQRQLANKSLSIMLKSFTSYSTDMASILRARQQLLDYGFKETEAIVDMKTAEAWLFRLAGGK